MYAYVGAVARSDVKIGRRGRVSVLALTSVKKEGVVNMDILCKKSLKYICFSAVFVTFSFFLFVPVLAAEDADEKVIFNGWLLDEKRCFAVYDAGEVILETDGRIENESIFLRMRFDRPLHSIPTLTLNHDEHQILEVEGYGTTFNFELDYDAKAIAGLFKVGKSGLVLFVEPYEWDKDSDELLAAQGYNISIPLETLPGAVLKASACA